MARAKAVIPQLYKEVHMINEEDKYKKDLVSIIKRYDLDSNHSPKYWPEISDSTKANIAKNIDKNISADSIIAVFDTTLFGNSCKNGIVFTVLGLYNIESFSSPEYANYSNIKSIELQEKKVNINLKGGRIITNYNCTIKNRVALCDLLKELVQYNSEINDSLNNDVQCWTATSRVWREPWTGWNSMASTTAGPTARPRNATRLSWWRSTASKSACCVIRR